MLILISLAPLGHRVLAPCLPSSSLRHWGQFRSPSGPLAVGLCQAMSHCSFSLQGVCALALLLVSVTAPFPANCY